MTEKKSIRKQTGVRLDAELIKTLKHLAVDTGRSFTSLVEEAVQDLLKKHKKKTG
ncbi:MAG TPA: ribbon-helix-helix domain-containing protein [Syntrophales bacterium]|nr:ribbon-helix-helix domain-containing protein [Syntrophales bacterium]